VDATQRWLQLMQGPEEHLPLDEAAFLIAAHGNPALDVGVAALQLDSIAAHLARPDMAALCRLLFEDLGLRGDHENYDDPRNSFIDQVLARRLGIPISLSVLLMEIGRRGGLRLEGVGMPGHFLVRDPASPGVLIDAFNRGRRLDRADCERLLHAVTGTRTELTPAMLAPTGPRAILARMLANLDRSFDRRGDTQALGWVSTLRLGLPDLPAGDRLQLANRLGSLGRFDAAADLLEVVAADQPAGDAASRLRADAASLRARLN
jgi:regulator of sirC expression with transglutaminase-like and TPR domain